MNVLRSYLELPYCHRENGQQAKFVRMCPFLTEVMKTIAMDIGVTAGEYNRVFGISLPSMSFGLEKEILFA